MSPFIWAKEPHDKRAKMSRVWFNKRLISQTNKLNKVTKRLTKCISPYFDEADTILLLEEGSSLRFKTTKMTADNHLAARFLFLESVRIINIWRIDLPKRRSISQNIHNLSRSIRQYDLLCQNRRGETQQWCVRWQEPLPCWRPSLHRPPCFSALTPTSTKVTSSTSCDI